VAVCEIEPPSAATMDGSEQPPEDNFQEN